MAMSELSAKPRETAIGAHARDNMRADPETESAIVNRWREASPAEHGRVLWGLLEFADLVQRGKNRPPKAEPPLSLPTPFAERPPGR